MLRPDSCRLLNCPNPKSCFLGRARRDVAKADILVVNHHMLFSDLAIKREVGNFSALAVLPSYRRAIIDEAHSVEDSATEYFGAEATRAGALALIGRFIRNDRGRERGLLPYLSMKLIKEKSSLSMPEIEKVLDALDNRLHPALAASRDALIAAFDAIRHLTAERCGQLGREIKWRLTQDVLHDEDLREIHAVYVLPAVEEVLACAESATTLMDLLNNAKAEDRVSEPPFVTELYQLEAFRDRLVRLSNTLAEGTSDTLAPNTIRWIEIETGNTNVVRIVRTYKLRSRWRTGCMATCIRWYDIGDVGVRRDRLFQRAVGLDRVPNDARKGRHRFAVRFQSQALLCIPTDNLPRRTSAHSMTIRSKRSRDLKITRGHAFILSRPSRARLCPDRLDAELKAAGVTALKRGRRADPPARSVSAASACSSGSFWEGGCTRR